MRENFDKAFELVVGHEGGFTDDRRDRGNWTSGKIGVGQLKGTKFGVSAMAYPNLDIKNLTLDQAKDIYLRDYWNKARCDDLPDGIDYLVFDAAINHGIGNAAKLLQRSVGAVDDGVIGPKTIALVKTKDPKATIKEFAVRRFLFWAGIKTFATYGLGWFRRGVETLITALEWRKPALDQSKEEPTSFMNNWFRRV